MMKKILLVTALAVLVLVALAGIGAWWLFHTDHDQRWTTSSPRAAEELDAGLDAYYRHHWSAAVEHIGRALELDPDLVIARYLWAKHFQLDPEARTAEMAALAELDRSGLNDRERFLLTFWFAMGERDIDAAEEVTRAYVAEQPEDPLGVEALCDVHWVRQQWDKTVACYERLFELFPSQVHARLNSGYIELARGRFEAAEEAFEAYRFVAPDRPEPYFALGKLDTARGRYPQAFQRLEKALAIDRSYCDAWVDLGYLQALAGRPDACRETVETMVEVEGCEWLEENGNACLLRILAAYVEGEEEEILGLMDSCNQGRRMSVLGYRIALANDREDLAVALEERVAERLSAVEEASFPAEASTLRGLEHHFQGVRAYATGDLATAAEHFAAADERLDYWGMSHWALKLFNRLDLMTTLTDEGRLDESQEVLAAIEEVNPRYAEQMSIGTLDRLFVHR